MAQELTCKGLNILFRPFDDEFLAHQRLAAPALSSRASQCYTAVQDLESKELLKNLLSTNDYRTQFDRFSASIVYALTFGFRVETGEEWQIQASRDCTNNMMHACQVGAWVVDSLPVLNYLPAPLTPWKKIAEKWHAKWSNLHITNMRDALKREGWNWTKDFSNSTEAQQMTEKQVSWNLGILCDAGVETTGTMLQIFALACLAYPDWILKAQEELDHVVGKQRLPNFEDLENLPYVHAVIEETFRWRNILPGGVPHATIQDDWYNGYLIPKGSIIMPLFIAMRNDEHLFDSPSHFRPERWINKKQSGNFGYGRRVCPGRFIARNSLAIAVARLLWAYNISSKDGKKPQVQEKMFTTGFVSAPKAIEAVFDPRSERHKQVIEESWEAADKDVAKMLDKIREKLETGGLAPRA